MRFACSTFHIRTFNLYGQYTNIWQIISIFANFLLALDSTFSLRTLLPGKWASQWSIDPLVGFPGLGKLASGYISILQAWETCYISIFALPELDLALYKPSCLYGNVTGGVRGEVGRVDGTPPSRPLWVRPKAWKYLKDVMKGFEPQFLGHVRPPPPLPGFPRP